MSNRPGFTIIELLASVSIIMIVLLGGNMLVKMVFEQKGQIESFKDVSDIKNQLAYYLNNKQAMINTINRNATTSCLATLSNCLPGSIQSLNVYDSNPVVGNAGRLALFDQSSTRGFSQKGIVCDTYPSVECPFKYVVTWTPQCGSDFSRCRAPTYIISANFEVASDYKGAPINSKMMSFQVARSAQGEQADAVCTAFGGTYDFTNNRCLMPMRDACPNGSFFVGLTSSNQKICKGVTLTTPPIKCPLGSVAYRIDASGNMYCRDGCYISGLNCSVNMWTGATNCPDTVIWSPGLGITAPGGTPGFNLDPSSSDGDGDSDGSS